MKKRKKFRTGGAEECERMNSVNDSAVDHITTTGDRIEGQPVRCLCFGAVLEVPELPAILGTSKRGKALAAGVKFDFIYCAGRFDYLFGVISKAVVKLFSGWRPSGDLMLMVKWNALKLFWPTQGCGQWSSFFGTERMGALHG